MSDAPYRGRFVWAELMTSDPAAAQKFYLAVLPWGTSQFEGGPMPYTMWTSNGTSLGGVMTLPDEAKAAGAPPHWLAYIGTPDVDGTVAQATTLGGKVLVKPQDIPTVGRFAVLQDPQGAVFAVYTPAGEAPGHEGKAGIGEFSWHELATTDQTAALDFYTQLFGWDKADAMDMGPGGIYQMYSRNGLTLGGVFTKPKEMPGPPAWLIYVTVASVHKLIDTIKAEGGTILNGPMEVPGGEWIAQCMDPQGAAFAIHAAKGSDQS